MGRLKRFTGTPRARSITCNDDTSRCAANFRNDRSAARRALRLRNRHSKVTSETSFFVGTRGQRLGQGLGQRQVHRVFIRLRDQLGWVNRGAHDGPRIHDLRHSFAVRRVMLWHEHGTDIDQAMLALSTYMGHVKISNTYWYLTGVPELMALAGGKFEQFAKAREVGHA